MPNQESYQGSQAQQDIQSIVDPLAYAQRQMRLKASTDRLGQLYGQDPSAFSYRAPSAYAIPGTGQIPQLSTLTGAGQTIAGNLSTADVTAAGTDPTLIGGNSANGAPTAKQSYFKA
jgi:hypothetical protein